MLRPGKYIEYDFPLHEVNRLAVKEANAKKPIYTMHKWWARRLSCVFRTILLASAIDWKDWDRLEPWLRDDDGNYLGLPPADVVQPESDGGPQELVKVRDERQYHRRKRSTGLNSAWERLYYRLDDEANAVIRWAFTKPKDPEAPTQRLSEHLAALGLGELQWGRDSGWWKSIDWDAREPITVLDPFMGGGTTIVEALRLGANVVGVDLNPVAWFVVKKETDGCDLDLLEQGFQQVEAAVAEEIKQYYKTTCPCCGEKADVMYVFWVKLAPCFEQTCSAHKAGELVPLYNSFVIAKKTGGKRGADVPRNKDGKPGMKLVEGPEKGIQFIKCPNPECGEIYGSKERVYAKKEDFDRNVSTCPCCKTSFNPQEGYAGNGKYTCPSCKQEDEILKAAKANIPEGMDRNVPLPHRMFGVELYCPHCEYKGYKNADTEDMAQFERAKAEFEANRETLDFPMQEIPNEGAKTKVDCDMEGHGYHYWYEMFSERQLLCLCRLRDAIISVEDRNVREYLLLSWSDFLSFNNVYCRYNPGAQKQQEVFSTHAFNPTITYSEPNVWGAKLGTGSYLKYAAKMAEGPAWASATDDNFFSTDSDYAKRPIRDTIYWHDRRVELLAQSSEDLSNAESGTASLVITDPPYKGNVMYAELSDFFYVWLRTALAESYPDEFGPPLTPKDEEVVDQIERAPNVEFLHKDEEFFLSGLTRILAEAGRRLDADGMLAFTFHHQANEAWGSVLQAALNAGYYMTTVIPVHAEMVTSLHIRDKASISYDAVIVCRKQTQEPERVEWIDLSDRIYMKAERLVKELANRTNGNRLPAEDIYVIVIGKCMEEYSRHYWRGRSYVYSDNLPVEIEHALDGDDTRNLRGIGEIVDQLVEESEGRMWPPGLDPISRFYVVNFLGQTEVPWDRLQRRLRNKPGVTLEALQRRQLVRMSGSKVKVLTEPERRPYLEGLLAKDDGVGLTLDLDLPEDAELTLVDKLHLLTLWHDRGSVVGGRLEEWSRNATFKRLLECVARYTDPKASQAGAYSNFMEQVGPGGQTRMQMEHDTEGE